MESPRNVPGTPSGTSQGGSKIPPGQDPIISLMTSLGIPATRANYIHMTDPGANPNDYPAELEAGLPAQFRTQADEDEAPEQP